MFREPGFHGNEAGRSVWGGLSPPISELCHSFCPCQRVFIVRILPLFRPRKRAGRGIMSGKVRFWAWPVPKNPPPTIANPDRQSRNTPFHRFFHISRISGVLVGTKKPPLSCPSPGLAAEKHLFPEKFFSGKKFFPRFPKI